MKLNGYRASHRNKWFLIQKGVLNQQEFCLFEYYIDSFDFDKRHSQFGTFFADIKEVSLFFHAGESTVYNWHNKLLSLGLILPSNKKHTFILPKASRYIVSSRLGGRSDRFSSEEKDQVFEVISQNIGVNLQKPEIKPQLVGEKPDILASNSSTKHLISSKVDLSLSPSGIEEYKQLSMEDMRWIDANVKEEIVAT